jgi:S1-C subfamily serine protease
VVRIKTSINTGAGFTIDVDQRQYLVTSSHLIPNSNSVELWYRGEQGHGDLVLSPIPIEPAFADVAVFPLDTPITRSLPAEPTMEDLAFSQRGYFVGYPHGFGFSIHPEYEIPLVKGCVFSGELRDNDDGFRMLLLDGLNNPGFSGGPVVFRPAEQLDRPFQIAGITSGWWKEDVEQPEGWSVTANSGIIVAVPIEYAIDSIKAWAARRDVFRL